DLANEMLQTLLEERFGLKVHRETREVQGYHLVVGKNGPKLTASAPPPDPPAVAVSQEDRTKAVMENMRKSMKNAAPGSRTQHRSGKRMTSAQLANMISGMVESPVVDMTELSGRYDVVLET